MRDAAMPSALCALPASLSKATFVSRRTSVLKPIKNSINEGDEPDKAVASFLFFFLPFLVKKSLEYLPAIMSLRGTLPSSSMISAMWST